MTERDEFELLLDRFFGEGPSEIDDGVIEAGLREVEKTAQWRARMGPWRFNEMPQFAKIAIAAAAVLAVALVGIQLLPDTTPVATSPSPSATQSPTTSPSPSRPPSSPVSSSPSPVAAATCPPRLPVQNEKFTDCTYLADVFPLPFTIQGRPGWSVYLNTPLVFQAGTLPGQPANARRFAVGFSVLDHVYETPCHAASDGHGGTVPYTGKTAKDFWTWLRRNVPMATFDRPHATTIGGLPAEQALSTTKINQIIAACPGSYSVELNEGTAIAENPGAERLTVVIVHGRTVLIDTGIESSGPSDETDSAFFPTFEAEADAFLATLTFR